MADFGTISVSKLNEYIKHKFEGDLVLRGINVSGEVSNCKTYASGHMYFTLKDSASAIRCVMFRGYRQTLSFDVCDGDSVIVKGDVGVYVKEGGYQLYATGIKRQGEGELYEKFLALKAKLSEEGLFDDEHKKPLPRFAEKIGVITSDSGAVLHDIKNVVSRRFPLAQIVLFPSRVQGEGADEELISALERMDESGCDAAIIGRGGGSIEDLWQFNSEALARAIYEVNTPIISAVGHETDFTICDYVCDMRAPTPSAAAELAVPDERELRVYLSGIENAMISGIMEDISSRRSRTEQLKLKINSALASYSYAEKLKISALSLRLKQGVQNVLFNKKTKAALLGERLEANNPISLMKRGYSAVYKGETRLAGIKDVLPDDELRIILADGEMKARVTEVKEK